MSEDSGDRNCRWLLSAGASSPALVAIALLAPVGALAQEAGAGAAATDAAVLKEVMVTARRRGESLASVPATIAAFSEERLEQQSIRSDSDLQLVAPGLTIRQTQGNNSLTYSIRGQSADTFSGSPSAVIAYMNEVPLAVAGAQSFYDMESIQVLKGPQGTLFGRNTTGGAVLYTSAKPTSETAGLLRARVGNLNLLDVQGMLNVPLADTVLLRVAFDIIGRDGYIHNLRNDQYLGELERKSGRVSLTINPSETVSNTTVLQYTDRGGTNTGASYLYSVYPCGATNNGFALTCSSGLLFSPALDAVFQFPGAWAAYLAANPDAYPAGLGAYVDEQKRIGAFATYYPGDAHHDGTDRLLQNTTTFDVNGNLQVKNILGASKSTSDSDSASLGGPFVTILTQNFGTGDVGNELVVESVSEELQLLGKAAGGNLDYIVGVYLQDEKTDTTWPQTYFDLRPILAPAVVTNAFRIENKTSAVYGQGTWDLSSWVENLRVTAGIRYTWERVSIKQLPRSTYTFGAPDQHNRFTDPSWELGLEYQATPSLFAYLKTRGSFRSGGFNGSAPPVDAIAQNGGNIFESEHTRDIEGGLKFRGDAFGRPATLSLGLYHQWIDDVQRVEFPDPDGPGGLASIAVTANVPSAKVYGLELDAVILAADWLQIGMTGAYTHASFSDGNVELFGNPYQYGPVGDTPKASGTFFAQATFPTQGGEGDFSARCEVYGQTSQYFSNAADSVAPDTELPGYALVNARLQWTGIMGGNLSVALFGKNLLDKAYFTGGMTLAAALGHNAAAVGEPRTYGLELSYKY
ncbi:MAG: hypothetical protein EPO21_11040 [Chloroflexota bacterium]|nr:MAG: hypothetical protein EPO21_11040 [Chloroflexota bacterium]